MSNGFSGINHERPRVGEHLKYHYPRHPAVDQRHEEKNMSHLITVVHVSGPEAANPPRAIAFEEGEALYQVLQRAGITGPRHLTVDGDDDFSAFDPLADQDHVVLVGIGQDCWIPTPTPTPTPDTDPEGVESVEITLSDMRGAPSRLQVPAGQTLGGLIDAIGYAGIVSAYRIHPGSAPDMNRYSALEPGDLVTVSAGKTEGA